MACCNINEKMTKLEKNEKYLHMAFTALKKCGHLELTPKTTHFNNTEMRLISEILDAKYKGERLISTQIAKKLGVTRSAISQIVNRLEAQGILQRVADEVDRKIAYIEITENALEMYGDDLKICVDFVGRVVERFGVEKVNNMCAAFEEFCAMVEVEQADFVKKRKYTK